MALISKNVLKPFVILPRAVGFLVRPRAWKDFLHFKPVVPNPVELNSYDRALPCKLLRDPRDVRFPAFPLEVALSVGFFCHVLRGSQRPARL